MFYTIYAYSKTALIILGLIIMAYNLYTYFTKKKNSVEDIEQKNPEPKFVTVDCDDPLPEKMQFRIVNKRTGIYAKTYREAVTFRDMNYNSFEPLSYQRPKIDEKWKPTGKYFELYDFVMNQELTKEYLQVFPFGIQFLCLDHESENYAFKQFCKKYPAGVGKMFPIMHVNCGKDTIYLVGDDCFLYHQELDAVSDEFVRYDTCEQLWNNAIKTDIESAMLSK